jgi:hypothetical protein
MNRRKTCLALTFFVASAIMLGADNPRAGTWKQNLEKSTYSAGPKPTTPATLRIEAVGSGERMTVNGSSEGKPITYSYTSTADGKTFPTPGSPYGDMGSIKTIDTRTTEMVYTRNGKVSRKARRTVSADGKTLIIEATGTNAKGEKYQSTAVFEKQ